jgi:hypothetical protein
MAQYIIKSGRFVDASGKNCGPGELIELPDDIAQEYAAMLTLQEPVAVAETAVRPEPSGRTKKNDQP